MAEHAEAASQIRPPMDGTYALGGADDVATVAGTASAATATLATPVDCWISIACSSSFNIRFSEDGTNAVEDPVNTGSFPAGVHSFCLNAVNSHFKVTATAAGYFTYWRSSRT